MSENLITLEAITESVIAHLRRVIARDSFDAHFAGLRIRIEDDHCASIVAPTRHASECLARLYKTELIESVRASYPNLVDIHFCSTRQAQDSSAKLGAILNDATRGKTNDASCQNGAHPANGFCNAPPSRAKSAANAYVSFEPRLSPVFRLESFENGIGNKIACAAAQTVVETPGVVYCPLYLFGGHGLGKTHLLQGIALGILDRNPGAKILYTSCEAFANGYIAAVQNRSLDAFRARFRSCDALLIDDIQFLTGKTKTQEELLHTIQFLRSASKQVVLSANVPPADLARIDPRLAEILRSGLSIKLEFPEFELRVRLLHALAKRRNWDVDDGAARVLATHLEKSVGELDGALCKMIAVARANKVDTSAELALGALRDMGHLRNGPPTLKEVLDAASKVLNVKADDILSNKRMADIVHARHIAMHLAKHLTSHTVAEVGRFFGNRDHSTVLSALKKINDLMKREESVRLQLHQVRQLLGK